MRLFGRWWRVGRVVGTVALMAGVAWAVSLWACQPAPLTERVAAFWDARLQGDEAAAYQYETYAYTGALTLTQYIQARSPRLTHKAYTIDTIQEQENEAVVTINLQSEVSIPGLADVPLATAVTDQWVRLDDRQWYRKARSKNSARATPECG